MFAAWHLDCSYRRRRGALDEIGAILPAVRSLAIRHVAYGVEEKHYELVGLALIETLRVMLGTKFLASWSRPGGMPIDLSRLP